MRAILEAFHGILKESSLSAEQIVERAFGVDENGNPRKSIFALYREINPTDAGAKLGWVDGCRILEATGIFEPLRLTADRLGFLLVDKRTITPDRPTWEAEHAQDSADMGEMARLMDEGAPPADVQRVGCRLIRNLEETLVRYAQNYDEGVIAQRKAQ